MSEFKGFSKQTLSFFKELKQNNSKTWFEAHRQDYEEHVKKPSEALVVAMGKALETITPGINAIPKVNQSLFRLNRDSRFSHDKSPYKTNLGILWWEGMGKRMESSSFYFHLEDDHLMLGNGVYMFPKPMLETYREAVVGKTSGKQLTQAVQKLAKKNYAIQGKHYKKTPKGYDADHPNAELLLFNGLYSGIEMKIPPAFYNPDLIDLCFQHYQNMLPLHEWLRDFVVGK